VYWCSVLPAFWELSCSADPDYCIGRLRERAFFSFQSRCDDRLGAAEHRGVATGSVYMVFGLGNIFGITLGGFLMTAAFRFQTGLSTAVPSPANPTAFAAELNHTFLVVVGIAAVGTVLSLMRGTGEKGYVEAPFHTPQMRPSHPRRKATPPIGVMAPSQRTPVRLSR